MLYSDDIYTRRDFLEINDMTCQTYIRSLKGGDQTAEYDRRTMISALIMTFTEWQTSR